MHAIANLMAGIPGEDLGSPFGEGSGVVAMGCLRLQDHYTGSEESAKGRHRAIVVSTAHPMYLVSTLLRQPAESERTTKRAPAERQRNEARRAARQRHNEQA